MADAQSVTTFVMAAQLPWPCDATAVVARAVVPANPLDPSQFPV